MIHESSDQLLQLCREPINAGCEAAYQAIEDEIALACAEHGCPHPYLALESLNGPKEIWWINGFDSERQRRDVIDRYAKNRPLMAALERHGPRKSNLTHDVTDIVLRHRPGLSNEPWQVAGRRFANVIATKDQANLRGSVFEAPDGTFFGWRLVGTRAEAEALRTSHDTTVLTVQPCWGVPAGEWIDADPDFWSINPMSRRR